MRRTPHSTQFIAIALPLVSEGEIDLVQGIRQSLLATHTPHEVLVLSGAYEASLRKLANSGELAGAIGEFMSPSWVSDFIDKHVPIVQLGEQGKNGLNSVSIDYSSMGGETVTAFLQNRVSSLAFLGAAGPTGSSCLASAFTENALHYGKKVSKNSNFSPSLLRNFISSLSLPAGLLCATDRLAHLAALTARELGLKIPHDLSLIGVGNSRLESLLAGVPLSSFDLNTLELGKKAGSLMAKLIEKNGESFTSIKIRARLHERESSLRSSHGIARALAYLNSNPGTSVNAGELARLTGMSRRSFELSFLKEFGKTPGEFLRDFRRLRAVELLKGGNLRIWEIAQACGYDDHSVFSAAFKKWTGRSPRDFRNESAYTRLASGL